MDNQELLECPYDKHHRILKHRMQLHLIKCRRNHMDVVKVTCPFNITHVLNKPELELHVQDCPDRKTYEAFSTVEEPVTRPTIPPPMPEVPSEENWDDEDVPTYNPRKYVIQAAVLRTLHGAQPAERKQFRKQERLRFLSNQDKN